jgi:hypothetical protein
MSGHCDHNAGTIQFMNGKRVCKLCWERDQPLPTSRYPEPFSEAWRERMEVAQRKLDALLKQPMVWP